LTRSFKELRVDLQKHDKEHMVLIECWFGDRRKNAQIRTCASHIKNMITGVTKGYKYLMRFVYAHFPINVTINDKFDTIEVRNFLGEKLVRRVVMLPGCKVKLTGNKDEISVEGIDIEEVSQSCANIHQSTLVKVKDIRKFLDGIYVSEKMNQ
jgi:large subunit ribosomal protein L9e